MTNNTPVSLEDELKNALNGGAGPKISRFVLACLSGIPVAGGVISGVGGAWSEKEQGHVNNIFSSWLKLQEDEIKEIGKTIMEVMMRIDQTSEEIRERLESPEYLKLIKKCFRDWSAAESEEKRVLIRNLLANSASCKICSDDVIRLFINWVGEYSEAHFAVIREVYGNPGSTRQDVWMKIHGESVREDSAEADMFKLLIHDLSVGHIVRQHREKDYHGNYIIKKPQKSAKNSYSGTKTATSAFDDDKEYELTELGKQFVHYTMNEIVPRLATA